MTVDLTNLVHRDDGHDGAHYQIDPGGFDLSKVREIPMDWLAWKCSQSDKGLDRTYNVVEPQAEALGFRWFLAYHWLSGTTDPGLQAEHFLRNYGKKRSGKGAMGDVEELGDTVEKAVEFYEYVESDLRQPCANYTGIYVDHGNIWKSPEIRESKYGLRPMIVAAYVSRANLIARLTTLGLLELTAEGWQWTSNGIMTNGLHIPGIIARADIDTVITPAAFDLCCGIKSQQPNTPTTGEDEVDQYRVLVSQENFPAGGYDVYVYDVAAGTKKVQNLDQFKALGYPEDLPYKAAGTPEQTLAVRVMPRSELAGIPDWTPLTVTVPPIEIPPVTVEIPPLHIAVNGTIQQ